MKRVDTFGFFTLLAAGVPPRSAWRSRSRRLTPFSGSLVRSALLVRRARLAWSLRWALGQFARCSLALGRAHQLLG